MGGKQEIRTSAAAPPGACSPCPVRTTAGSGLPAGILAEIDFVARKGR
ncbi:hypothetical protein [Microbispora sp. NPDC049125]